MQQNGSTAATWEESRTRLIPASIVGTMIEWYDVAIYAQAAALVFGTLFFPEFSAAAGTLAAFATFGVGYFARPFGAAVFGHLGDKYGRRFSLIATLMLMGFATVLIGLLPTYGTIGIAAPLLLVLCRLLQGAGVGAEYAGAVTMVAEYAPRERRGYFASMPASGVFLGIGLAAGVSAAVATLPEEQLLAWGWRIPFLASIVVIGIGMFIRMRILESPVFAKLEDHKAKARMPVVQAAKSAPRTLILAMLANGPLAFNIYVVQAFALSYLDELGVDSTTSLVALLLGCATGAACIPLVGIISDRTGRRPVYIALAAFSAAISFPFFLLLDTRSPVLICVAMMLTFGLGILAMFGSQAAYFTELFDARYRFSAFALAREVPGAVLAAPAPALATALTAWAGGEPWLVAAAMVVVATASGIAVALLPETRGRSLDPIADEPEGAARAPATASRPLAEAGVRQPTP